MVSPQFLSPTMYINHEPDYQNQFQSAYQMSNPASQLQCPPFQPSSSAVYQNPASANTSCLPVATKSTAPVLPSSAINTAKLVPAMQTIAQFPKLQTESRVSVLAVMCI